MGRPVVLSMSIGYIQPSLTLALWDMASSSFPALRWVSIHFQSSVGSLESSALNGESGTLSPRKKILRCRLRWPGIAVHSYERKAVNLPGWLFSSAILQASAHTVAVTFGLMNALTGALPASLR